MVFDWLLHDLVPQAPWLQIHDYVIVGGTAVGSSLFTWTAPTTRAIKNRRA